METIVSPSKKKILSLGTHEFTANHIAPNLKFCEMAEEFVAYRAS